jgi:hypothetical protein
MAVAAVVAVDRAVLTAPVVRAVRMVRPATKVAVSEEENPMQRLLVICFVPFVLAGCTDKANDAAEPAKSAEPAKDPASQDKAGTDKKEEDKGGW